jgi:zinc/manganese transport system substrate-binding protein
MAQIDPPEAAQYRERGKAFIARWQEAATRWQKQAAPLKGMPVIVYHRDLSYLLRWLGLQEMGSLEPRPGLPPSATHLSGLLESLKAKPAKAVLRAAHNDPRAAQWLSERAGIPVVVLPYTVGGTEKVTDLFTLYDVTLSSLLRVVQ